MGKILLPPDITEVQGKVIFLAGPIQGAPLWQNKVIEITQSLDESLNIANPRREYLDNEFVYEAQVDWETHFLRRAAQNGVIMFWLAKEHEHICTRAYAQTSRFELGEWKMEHKHGRIKLVVGIENGFSNARYIKRRLSQDCPDIPVCSTLEETCRKAVEFCH